MSPSPTPAGDIPSADPSLPLELVLTTEADLGRAERLALTLLERRLVACVSLLPVRSTYRWEGRVEQAEEVQLLLKTSPDRLGELHRAVRALHSYTTPEWIHWRASAGGGYASWCAAELAAPGGTPPSPSR